MERSQRGARGDRRCSGVGAGRGAAAGGRASRLGRAGVRRGGRRRPAPGSVRKGVRGGRGAAARGGCRALTPDPLARSRSRSAAGPGRGAMGSWASKGRAARLAAPQPQPEEGLDLSRLPPELLLAVLSHVPPRALLGRCRRVCRGWRALVDGQALWLRILARDGSAAGRALLSLVRSCLPPAGDARPCPLGRFCERQPIGRNLICNPCGQGAEAGGGRRGWISPGAFGSRDRSALGTRRVGEGGATGRGEGQEGGTNRGR